MDARTLERLCCPATHQPLTVLDRAALERLNARIAAGGQTRRDGTPVESPLTEALITRDGQRIYPVDDGIPVLLEEYALPGSAIDGDEDTGAER